LSTNKSCYLNFCWCNS